MIWRASIALPREPDIYKYICILVNGPALCLFHGHVTASQKDFFLHIAYLASELSLLSKLAKST